MWPFSLFACGKYLKEMIAWKCSPQGCQSDFIRHIRDVTKILSCQVNTTRRWRIKQLGSSFGFIFFLFSLNGYFFHVFVQVWNMQVLYKILLKSLYVFRVSRYRKWNFSSKRFWSRASNGFLADSLIIIIISVAVVEHVQSKLIHYWHRASDISRKKSKISREFEGQIRGKIGRFRGKKVKIRSKIGWFHGKFWGETSPRNSQIKTANFVGFLWQISLKSINFASIWPALFNVFLTGIIICSYNNSWEMSECLSC